MGWLRGRWNLDMRWGSEKAEEGCREATGGHVADPVLWLGKGRNICIAGSSSRPPSPAQNYTEADPMLSWPTEGGPGICS